MKNRIFLGFFLAVWVSLSLLNPWAGRLEGAGVQAKSRASGERALEDEEALTTIHLPLVVDGLINLPNFVDTPFGVEVRPTSDLPGMQKVSGAGASFTRLNGIFWANVEPVEGQRNWSAVAGQEVQLKFAAANDLKAVLVVRHTPAWAQKVPGAFCGPIKEDKLDAFGDFLYDLVARYSKPPYYVKYWEIYNEPDVDPSLVKADSAYGCWGDPADPYYGGGYFAEMLKVAYPKIKAADPEAQVLVGGLLLSCNPASLNCSSVEITASKFFEGILVNQGGDYFDGVAFHNYDFYLFNIGAYFSRKWNSAWDTTGPALGAKVTFLTDLMTDHGVSGKFLMDTENAILCGSATDPPGGPGCESDPDSAFELTKAYYVAQAYAAALATGLTANIWFSHTGWRNSGLLYDDLTPRPAFDAYEFSRDRLGEATYIGPIGSSDVGGDSDLLGYKFQRPNGKLVWVIWAKDRVSHLLTLAIPPDTAWDVFGNQLSLLDASALSIALEPRYLEWDP